MSSSLIKGASHALSHADPATTDAASDPSCTVAALLVKYLQAEGVRKVFGIPGGALVWVMDELRRQTPHIDYVICRHETGAAYMADGYARVNDGLGVVIVTSGPGATNALTGAMNAQASDVALLVITGEVPEKYFGEGYLQEGEDAKLDVTAVFRNALQSSNLVTSPSNFQTLFQQALRNARSLPNRAVHIGLPNDVAGTCMQPPPWAPRPASYQTRAACTDAGAVGQALASLAAARRPLIFLGNGSRRALAQPERLRAFTHVVERFGIAVMTTPNAKGVFPESHALSLRSYGMCGSAWPDLYMRPPADPAHYDALLVLGSTLGELATSVVASDLYSATLVPAGEFIQVDLDSSIIGRDFPITQGIVAEIGATLDALCEQAAHLDPDQTAVKARKADIDQIKASVASWADPAGRDATDAPLHPAALMRVINEALHEGQVFIDAGNCVGWSLNNLVIDPPLRYQSALAMGPMGFAVAAVVGAKLAAPDQTCLAIVGDGAFMMHGAEISTAAQNRAGAIWIVLNDNDLAMVSQGMAQLLPPASQWTDYYSLGKPDLVMFAQGLGAQAVRIGREQGAFAMAQALADAIASAQATGRPQVIVVDIDTHAAPPYGWPHLTPPDCCS
ncbi:MAG: thiamine pyrophosphate-binding protein [Rubrivivax sp.]|nr:MAG: thiamine pyrophosphate-binding protein [Rubrivivax sp.]